MKTLAVSQATWSWVAILVLLSSPGTRAQPAPSGGKPSDAPPRIRPQDDATEPEDEDELDPDLDIALRLERAFEKVALSCRSGVVAVTVFRKDQEWYDAHSKSRPEGGWRIGRDEDLRYPGHRPVTSGSGFIVSEDGYVYTTRKVVLDPKTGEPGDVLDIEIDSWAHGRARLVGADPTIDFALLKIETPARLQALEIGNSYRVRPGQWAIAMGDPDGPERTFAVGTISNPASRDCYQDELGQTLIQTSLRVPPGAAGGPLVNIRGEAMGILMPRGVPDASPAGVGALPINLARAIHQSFIVSESRRSPWLGISVLNMTRAMRKGTGPPTGGVKIDNVFDPSPAAMAGVQVGDVLVSLGGERLAHVYDFQHWLYSFGVGKDVELGLWREGEELTVRATIERRPKEARPR